MYFLSILEHELWFVGAISVLSLFTKYIEAINSKRNMSKLYILYEYIYSYRYIYKQQKQCWRLITSITFLAYSYPVYLLFFVHILCDKLFYHYFVHQLPCCTRKT